MKEINSGKDKIEKKIPQIEKPKIETFDDIARSSDKSRRIETFDDITKKRSDWSIDTSGMKDKEGKNKAMSPEETHDFVRRTFPPEHTNNLKFEYVAYYKRDKDEFGRSTIRAGEFHNSPLPEKRTITLYAQNNDGTSTDRMQMEETIKHEVGHNVYENVLDKEQKNEWNRIAVEKHAWRDEKEKQAADILRDKYGGDVDSATIKEINPTMRVVGHRLADDFADAYHNYLNGKLKPGDDKYEFMEKYVFTIKER